MSSSFPPPCVLPLPLEERTEEQEHEQLLEAFGQRLFSDDPPEWAAETMKVLRRLPPR